MFMCDVLAATAAGTVINNTAAVNYTVDSAGFVKASNTDSVIVQAAGASNTATLNVNVTPELPHPGDIVNFDISVTNTGVNDIVSPEIIIVHPPGATLQVPTGYSVATAGNTSTVALNDLQVGDAVNFVVDMLLPLSQPTGIDAIDIDFGVDNVSFVGMSVNIDVLDRTTADLSLLHYDVYNTMPPITVPVTQYMNDSGGFVDVPMPVIKETGQLVSDSPVSLKVADKYHNGDVIFIQVADADQNIGSISIDTVVANLVVEDENSNIIDSETLLLKETGANTGVFLGYIKANNSVLLSKDGVLNVATNATVLINYLDNDDVSDSVESSVLIDPYGVVFDSRTGAPLDGITVSIINTDTGSPATVYGDDGVSVYPSVVVTGSTVTDSGGKVYVHPKGNYRFPFLAEGNYRLEVMLPAGSIYVWPSAVVNEQIQEIPGAPFALDIGSRGEIFSLVAGPPLHLDIPVDANMAVLYLRKSASKAIASLGENVKYQIDVENTRAAGMVDSVVITDVLPHGFKYRAGTTKIDNISVTDPVVASDGRTLQFNLGSISSGAKVTLNYVTQIGAASPGDAENIASAAGVNGEDSNTATALVKVREELFRSRAILMGRVAVSANNAPYGQSGQDGGIPNVRLYLENGAYAITDENGLYHFEGVMPGTHVVQLDVSTLPKQMEIIAQKSTRHNGNNWSRFIDVQPGSTWREDFDLILKPRVTGNVGLELIADLSAGPGDVKYKISLEGSGVPLRNTKLIVMLPKDSVYIPESTVSINDSFGDPEILENSLTYRLGDKTGDWEEKLTLLASRPETPGIEANAIAKALLIFDSPSHNNMITPVAEVNIGPALKQAAHLADRIEKETLIDGDINLKGDLNSIDVASNPTSITSQPEDIPGSDDQYIASTDSIIAEEAVTQDLPLIMVDRVNKEIAGLMPGDIWNTAIELESAVLNAANEADIYDESWLAGATSELEWMFPQNNALPNIPSVNIGVKHDPKHSLILYLNGDPVGPLNHEFTHTNKPHTASYTLWRGVDLENGDNTLELVVTDSAGNEISRQVRQVHYSTAPVKVELVKELSVLKADGITVPVVAVRMLDKQGYPAREGNAGIFDIESPYKALNKSPFNKPLLPGMVAEQPMFEVGKDGIALIQLEPTTEAGEVNIRFNFMRVNEVFTVHLKPQARDWILVGFAQGTTGYNSLQGNTEQLSGSMVNDHLYQDGRIAFFAKGRVKGEWLITVAYDNDKVKDKNSLQQIIDPGRYYTVYGDNSSQGYDAASSSNLYFKIEKENIYAMFGDYSAGLNATQLSRYTRSLTGIKSGYRDDNYEIVLFTSQSNQAFVRDEIRGQGITGPYKLTRSNIILNTETINIVVRDRFKSEVIVSEEILSRHVDYSIDYDKGEITFRKPINSINQEFNHMYIVASYESYDGIDRSYSAGGRIDKNVNAETRVGLTLVHEGRVGGDSDLTGIDVEHSINEHTLGRAEIAYSTENDLDGEASGIAYLLEIEHRSDEIDAKAYYRIQADGFGLGQQSLTEQGMRKMGVNYNYHYNAATDLRGQVFSQSNMNTHAERNTFEAEINHSVDKVTEFRVGTRLTQDWLESDGYNRSSIINAGVTRQLLDHRLSISLDHEQVLGTPDNIDYPNRTMLGLDYKITSMTTGFAKLEWTRGDKIESHNAILGLRTRPWQGGELSSTINRYSEDGFVSTAKVAALSQTYKINELWSVNGSIERSESVSDGVVSPLSVNVPLASGSQNDFTATSIGVTYHPETWLWNLRTEFRDADDGDKWGIYTSAQNIGHSHIGLLGSLKKVHSNLVNGEHQQSSNYHFGLAYRRPESRWLVLNKFNWLADSRTGNDMAFVNRRLVNNLSANYQHGQNWQTSLQYGAKYVKETIDGEQYYEYIDLKGVETRYDLNQEWDVGFYGRMLHAYAARQTNYSSGISVGHTFVENIWVSLGYNFSGFTDQDFSRADYTSKGVYITFRMKFDQHSLSELLKWNSL